MSKQSDAKQNQGYTKEAPCCSRCKQFTFDVERYKGVYGAWYEKKKNMRCVIGGFKCSPACYCNEFSKKEIK